MSASPPSTATSSPKLSAMFENGSGDVLLVSRVAAFAVCVIRLVPPASNAMMTVNAGSDVPALELQASAPPIGTNDGVNGVPDGIDPRNFVGEKFQKIKNARDG